METPFAEPIYITRPLIPELGNINAKMKEVFDSKWLTNNGAQHEKLQNELRKYLKLNHLVLFNNGTLALLLGLKALQLSGEVITTPFTFPATIQALDWNGLIPVFCDIDKDTLNIDANQIEALITEKTSAILAVHVYGNPCNVNQINKIAEKNNLKVIYDAAHAFGTEVDGIPIGEFGDMTMFSFHATKLFNTIEGGALTFKDASLEKNLNLLKNFGIAGPEEVVLSGINAKLNEVQAGIGLEVLKLVEEEKRKREKIKGLYEKRFAEIEGIKIATKFSGSSNSYQYFVIEVDQENYGKSRDWLHEELKKYNIFTRKYFYPLCSDFQWYQDVKPSNDPNLSQARKSVQRVLALPFYGELQLESVEKICNIIKILKRCKINYTEHNEIIYKHG
ncbi:DegT/DnrJ/EryC1/StrS family aminotransferase [Clostridium formicaceticum]|uniref:Aminotransferase n=1 Tax=Clostridium formicaceticum TaxID=1497 RepID=A0AAC9WEP5_9CLOT|nr:DegT/DnrJ/EryC1/StrS family aminotransferase [Clostridium formicaceticum]AOY75662.1 aminotransferase [Clostridium formicaceticum]ARE85977.1 dTDP-4-amino-4,6-dideoxy-D-glucose transaminase [Clostridium formicaceticum]